MIKNQRGDDVILNTGTYMASGGDHPYDKIDLKLGENGIITRFQRTPGSGHMPTEEKQPYTSN